MTESTATDKARPARLWVIISAELAIFFTLIFVSTESGWKNYIYFRFLVLIPIYHAGISLGISGGILCAIFSSMLYCLVIPVDMKNMEKTFAVSFTIGTLVVYNGFAAFIGMTIGRSKRALKELSSLSEIFIKIAAAESEADVMRTTTREAMSVLEAKTAAYAILEDGQNGEPPIWRFFCFNSTVTEPEEMHHLDDSHPLMAVAKTNAPAASNSIYNDKRFSGGDGSLNSMIIAPVASGGETFGAVMLADKTDGEQFRNKDLSLAVYLATAAADIMHNVRQERKRREESSKEDRMKDLFSRFVSLSVADSLLDNPALLEGRWETVTMLVSDIRDFTTISENLAPDELVSQLNEYFSRMVDIVFENRGTIDKFIGDCIVAYWGAPAPDPEHAAHAAAAALRMAEASGELNAKWISSGKPPFKNGIAIHTGRVLLGNIGDERKRAFTVMGDEVDRAMALESMTKRCGGRILVSPASAAALDSAIVQKLEAPENSGFEELFCLTD